jgi:hypothetical protein
MPHQIFKPLQEKWREYKSGKHIPLYFFMHIPKTAGTSFRIMLNRPFRRAHILPSQKEMRRNKTGYIDLQEFAAEHPWRFSRIRLYIGHDRLGTEDIFQREQVYRLTFLRDPVQRCISAVKHKKRLVPEMADYSPEQIVQHFEHTFKDLQTTYFTPDLLQESDDIRLEQAIQRMNQFMFVGITESYAESIQLLKQKTNWRLGPIEAHNQANTEVDMPQDLIDQLHEWNQSDQQLYDAGRLRLEQSLKKDKA